jgi:transcriptional regulator GlxA family with amidase domain
VTVDRDYSVRATPHGGDEIGLLIEGFNDMLAEVQRRVGGAHGVLVTAVSRSAFALRFKELVGESPLEYLTRWRMHQASRWLRDGKSKLLEVAKQVGYDSDGAFNKAFKRVLGVTPGEFRRSHGGPSPGVPG